MSFLRSIFVAFFTALILFEYYYLSLSSILSECVITIFFLLSMRFYVSGFIYSLCTCFLKYTFLSLVKCTLHFLAMLVSLKLNRFVSSKLKSCLVLKLLNTPVSYLFLLLLGTVFISLSLNSAVTRWCSLPIYAPNFITIWSIWVFSFPQGDTHVSLCIFCVGIMFHLSVNCCHHKICKISSFMVPLPYFPMTLSYPVLSWPTFALKSTMMMEIMFWNLF